MLHTLIAAAAASPPAAAVQTQAPAAANSTSSTTLLLVLGSLALLAIIVWWIMKRANGGRPRSGGIPGAGLGAQFNRGTATGEFEPTDVGTTTFDDVAGVDEAVKKLKRVKRFILDSAAYNDLGGKPPQGILLVGPPGTGKTLGVKALAGETNAILFVVPGSYFVEMFVGRGAARVRELVATAKKWREETGRFVIIFIDEFDALGKKRSSGGPGGHDERDQTLNQLLVEMNGFTAADGILFIAATNRKDILDEAVLRPGRFTYHIFVDTPDKPGRIAILKVHMRNKPTEPGVPLEKILDHIASRTPGFSGADLAEVCNEGAVQAAERLDSIRTQLVSAKLDEMLAQGKDKKAVELARTAFQKTKLAQLLESKDADVKAVAEELNAFVKDQLPALLKPHKHIKLKELDDAIDILQMGDARESRAKAMGDEELWNTAIHEGGHYIIGHVRGDFGSSKATIMPRGQALGFVQSMSDKDKFTHSQRELETRVLQAYGGRLAQEKFLGVKDTGADNDFEQLNRIVRLMVVRFGMSELGEISINDQELQYGSSKYGDELLNAIDRECAKMRARFKAEAKQIIDDNADALLRVATLLKKEETVLTDRLTEAFDNKLPAEAYEGVTLPAYVKKPEGAAQAIAVVAPAEGATPAAGAAAGEATSPADEHQAAPEGEADASNGKQ